MTSQQQAQTDLEKNQHPSIVPDPISEPYSVFSDHARYAITAIAAFCAFLSPVGSSIYLPSLPQVSSSLGISIEKANLTITIFLIAQGVSPTLFGSSADVLGRRPVYLVCLIVFVASCIGLSLVNNYTGLMVLRLIQAGGSASMIALSSGLVADTVEVSKRATYITTVSIGAMLGPAVGPLIGGLLAEHFDWHATFVFCSIFGGVALVLVALFLPETLQTIVGNGSVKPPSIFNRSSIPILVPKSDQTAISDTQKSLTAKRKTFRDIDFTQPIRLVFEINVAMALIFNALAYLIYYCILTAISTTMAETYNLSETQTGLIFLSLGGGTLVSCLGAGRLMDRDFRRIGKQVTGKEITSRKDIGSMDDFPIERARYQCMPWVYASFAASVLVFGWTVDKHVNIAVPIISVFFQGATNFFLLSMASTLLVDLHLDCASSVTASNNLVRCLLGAAGTAFIEPLLRGLGTGWAFILLIGINTLALPLIFIQIRYGVRIRQAQARKRAQQANQSHDK